MTLLALHMCTRLRDGRVIVENAEQRRVVAQVVLKQGRDRGLFLFSLPDKHLHLVARCTEKQGSELCRRVEISLSKRLGLPVAFAMYPHVRVETQHHFERLPRYILTQHQHHGVQADPFRESTSLPDLLGMRTLGGYTARRLRRWFPRLSRRQVLPWLGVPSLEPQDGPVDRLVEAACRATGLPHLRGAGRQALVARRIVATLARPHLGSGELAPLLGVSRRSVQRLLRAPADERLLQAVRLQLGAEAALCGLAKDAVRS